MELDLSFNFFESVPIHAFRNLRNIKFLNFGSNRIKVSLNKCISILEDFHLIISPFQTIKEVDFHTLSSLEYIDLSRNQIGEIMTGTFLGMSNLKGLDFSVNTVKTVRIGNFLRFD